MQTQITRFFKSSQPIPDEPKEGELDSKEKKESCHEKEIENKKDSEPEVEVVSSKEQKHETKAKHEETAKLDDESEPINKDESNGDEADVKTDSKTRSESSAKRPADDEGGSQRKVMALSSAQATPTKAETKQTDQSNSVAPSFTPAKNLLNQDSKPPLASPLIDLHVVIRKKISNGAFALHENIGKSWFRALQAEFDKPYFKKLSSFIKQERSTKVVYPPENKVYSWTHHHDIKDTRVLILGQDPYHGPGQAHGLSFSVQKGVRTPPSLVNIFKELEADIPGFRTPASGDLTGWAKQGVLMLNTCLTVNQGQANSHQKKGWETFTDAVINWISKNSRNKVVFLLWGRPAQQKQNLIDKRHKILRAAHPSPLSAHNGFFSCAHFSQTNSFLKSQGLPVIDWASL